MRTRHAIVAVFIVACGSDRSPSTSPPPDPGRGSANDDAATPRTGPATDAGSIDANTDASTSTGVFVATGLVGRTISSFDDGQSWTDDKSDASGELCTHPATPSECYEGDRTARGITYFGGRFFATYAWAQEAGRSNSVRGSDDGKTWTPVLSPGGFGGIAAGNGAVVLAGPSGTTYMMVSTDLGTTWSKVDNGYGTWTNFRHVAFVEASGGRFVFGGDNNGFETSAHVVVSSDGKKWKVPTSIPAGCPMGFRLTGGFASVGSRIVMVGPTGIACRSDDGGDTWVLATAVGKNLSSHDLVSTGDRIWAWSAKSVHTTKDGVTWTETPLSPQDVSIGGVAWSPDTGTFVAVTSGYANGYANQHFYRSTDGVNWTLLPAANYVQSHPIMGITYGRVTKR